MNAEKSFYSLIGCAAAAGIIQQSYGMKNSYMVSLAVILWCGCIVVHILAERKQKQDSILLEERNNEFIRQIKIMQEFQKMEADTAKIIQDELTGIKDGLRENWQTESDKICARLEELGRQVEKSGHEEQENQRKSMVELTESVCTELRNIHEKMDNIDTANRILGDILLHNEKVCQRVEHLDNELVGAQQSVQEVIKDLFNIMQGILPDIQNGVDALKRTLEGVKSANESSDSRLEDMKLAIEGSKDDIEHSLNGISGMLQENMSKQSDIVGQYDLLLSKVNDEILVKMINDSNNMLQLLTDCYKILEINRRVAK